MSMLLTSWRTKYGRPITCVILAQLFVSLSLNLFLYQSPEFQFLLDDYYAYSQIYFGDYSTFIAIGKDILFSYFTAFSRLVFGSSDFGYFLYVNGIKEGGFYKNDFKGVMNFKTTLIEYDGDSNWVEETIMQTKNCLASNSLPKSRDDCDNCRYFGQRDHFEVN